jgi:hypothetical protein
MNISQPDPVVADYHNWVRLSLKTTLQTVQHIILPIKCNRCPERLSLRITQIPRLESVVVDRSAD